MSNDPRFLKSGDSLLIVQPEGAGISEQEATDVEWSLEIMQELGRHYPGHPWRVSFQGGALIVRHTQIADAVMMKIGRSGFGALLPPHKYGSRGEAVASAVRHAGELLEAFQMPRGEWSEDHPPIVPGGWGRGKTRGFH